MAKFPNQIEVLPCSEPGCDKTIPNHRWGKTKASDWFFQKDGHQWCPAHHPTWVASWRASAGHDG